MATTSDWSSVTAASWTTYATGFVTRQQLAMTDLIPGSFPVAP